MRVLHLIDLGADVDRGIARRCRNAEAAALGTTLLTDLAPCEQAVVVTGTRGAVDRAARSGLRIDVALPPSVAGPMLLRSIRKALPDAAAFDLAQCWDASTAEIAGGLVGTERVVLVSPDGSPGRAGLFLVSGSAAAGRLAEAGIHAPTRVIPPPARAADRAQRAAIRRTLRIEDQMPAVLLLGSPPQADALRFAFFISLLAVGGHRQVGLLSTSATQLDRGHRFAHTTGRGRSVVSERPLTDLLAAADVAIFDSGGPGPTSCLPPAPWAAAWPIAQAHAAGVPVVAPTWAATDGIYPPEVAEVYLAYNATLPELTRALLSAFENPEGRRRAAAALEARQMVAPERAFCDAIEEAWRGVAGSSAVPTRSEPYAEVAR